MVNDDDIVNIGITYERVKYIKDKVARRLISRNNPRKSKNWEYLEKFCNRSYDRGILPAYFFMSQYEGKRVQTKPEMKFLNTQVSDIKYVEFLKKFKHNYENSVANMIASLKKTKYILALYKKANSLETNEDLYAFKTFESQPYPDIERICNLGLISKYILATNNKLSTLLYNSGFVDENDEELEKLRLLLITNKEANDFYKESIEPAL